MIVEFVLYVVLAVKPWNLDESNEIKRFPKIEECIAAAKNLKELQEPDSRFKYVCTEEITFPVEQIETREAKS